MPNIDTFTQFGLPGLILFVLVFVLILNSQTTKNMSRDYRETSEAWRKSFDMHSERQDRREAESNEVLRGLTKVIAEK